jgi:hypothetical protein
VVQPYLYHNPTSRYSKAEEDSIWWEPALEPYLVDKRIKINKNLELLADIRIQPTAQRPTSDLTTISGSSSAIIGHPKLELRSIPTPQRKRAKVLTTTGTCTKKNYIQSKAGKKAEFHHTFGACIVEVVGDRFHFRQINAVQDGSFIDLKWEYRGGRVLRAKRALGIKLGDLHREFVDPNVVKATFTDAHSIVKELQPEFVVYDDATDFYPRNHHHRGDFVIQYAKHHYGFDNVEEWIQKTFDFVSEHTPANSTAVFTPSNHPDALARWIKETDPRTDPENCVFWSKTFQAMCAGAQMGLTGAHTIDAFAYWGGQMLKHPERAIFVPHNGSFVLKGVEYGLHGHEGPNGVKGSIRNLSQIGVKTALGHSHSAGICDGAYQGGMSCYPGLSYEHGPSSHLQCHILQYANGKRTLMFIVGDQYCANELIGAVD